MEGREHPSRYTLSSKNLEYSHPILVECIINKSRLEDIGMSDSEEHDQTRTLTTKMRKIMELVKHYDRSLETDTKRIKEFGKYLESYKLGEARSSKRTNGKPDYVQELRKSVSAIQALVPSVRWTRTRSSGKSKIRGISARIQCCDNQLSLLDSEAAKQIFNQIRQMQKPFEIMKSKRVHPEEWSFHMVEDGFCLNTGFVRSLWSLLEALSRYSELRIESDKYWGDPTFPSLFAHPYTKEHVIQYGERLSDFTERSIRLAQEIQNIAYETGSHNVDMVNPRFSTTPSASA